MDYIALITYISVMCITPGPNNIMVTASGANFGYRATVPHMLGVIVGGAIQIGVACLGLGIVFIQFPILHTLLAWVGLVYMLSLAWKMLGVSHDTNGFVGKPMGFTQAVLFQAVNAKAWVADITVASVFLPKDSELLIPTLIVIGICLFFTAISVNLWTLFGSSMRDFLKTDKNRFMFNCAMAMMLVITAGLIVVK